MADTMNIIAAHRLTGGTQWSLDWFPIASLIDQDKAVVTDGTNIYFFEFDATSVLAEDVVTHPYKVRPDDFATQGVWIEQQAVGTGGGSGTVTSVSVVTANGISGSVATATTTPAITLTLGAITPTTVNGLTLASAAVGFTISGGTTSKTLTVAADASVSGTNTGDSVYWTLASTVLSPTTAGNTVSIPKLDIYNVSTTGLLLANTTPSVIGRLIQYSPALQFTGTARDTDGAVSTEHHWRIENQPVNGNFPYSNLTISYALDAGSYNPVMSLKYINPYFGELTIPYVRCSAVTSLTLGIGTLNFGHSGGAGEYSRNTADTYATLHINNKNASSTGNILNLQWQSVNRLCVTREGNISAPHADGIKIGITAAEKLAFWAATPMAQPSAIANATGSGGGDAHTQLNLLLAQLRLMGLIAAA